MYQDYERAFGRATGLPLRLRNTGVCRLDRRRTEYENPFCTMVLKHRRSCAACLQVQQRLAGSAGLTPRSATCFAGLCDTAVPVKVGEKLIGFLHTGQVFLKQPGKRKFEQTVRQLRTWGVKVNLKRLGEAYFKSRVVTPEQYASMIGLLAIFAQHLTLVCHKILVEPRQMEPVAITRARQYIQKHQADNLSLDEVARVARISPFYFCKLFRRVTGLNFTQYVSLLRVEKAKKLLLDSNLRINDICVQIGFQSLTHFNRVFKRVIGQSPTGYRKRLPKFQFVLTE